VGGQGTFPLVFEVKGTPCVLSFVPDTFSGVDIFVLMHTIGAIFVKFSQLTLMKIIKIVAARCQILRLK